MGNEPTRHVVKWLYARKVNAMEVRNERDDTKPATHADLFQAVMCNIWDEELSASFTDKQSLANDFFYKEFHNAVVMARNVFGATIVRTYLDHDDDDVEWMQFRFRDGSTREINSNGGAVKP